MASGVGPTTANALATAPAVAALAVGAPMGVLALSSGELLTHGIDPSKVPPGSFVSRPPGSGDLEVVTDASQESLAGDALVTGWPHVRSAVGVTLRDDDGTALGWLWAFGSRTRFDDDTATALRLIAQHVTSLVATVNARDRAEGERREFADRSESLARVFEERTTFLAIAQHKLKTPLAVIAGWANALRALERLSPEERTSGIEAISNATNELWHQIDDLLDEARTELIGSSLTPGPLHLQEFVVEMLDVSRIDSRVHPTTVDIAASVRVHADPAALRQILAHLLDNAQKYSPSGGAICIAAQDLDGEVVELRVRDHGIGLDGDADVFAPFERADNARAVARGTGLGLHIVRLLVERMDGSITAEPGSGGDGSLFRVRLPAARRYV